MTRRVLHRLWWWRCAHRSHRLHLRCWHRRTYDSQCGKHNTTCFNYCGAPCYCAETSTRNCPRHQNGEQG